MRKEDIRPFAWGAAVGAIALPVLLLWAGWIVTGSSAREAATQMTRAAVVDNLAPICVAQFAADTARDQRLTEMKALDSWKRDDFVRENGWATMPGSTSPDSRVAEECARRLIQLEL